MNSTDDPSFFDAFHVVGFPASFIAIGGVRCLFSILALIFNAILIYITIRSRRLRNRCNALLAFDAICTGGAFICNIVTFAVIASGQYFIRLRSCFWLQLLPAIFINLLLNSMLCIGIDRLISVVAPIWISRQNPHIYICTLIMFCFAYAIYAIYKLYPACLYETPDLLVPCNLNDIYQGQVAMDLFRNCMIFTGLTILCYAAIWAIIRYKKSQQLNPQSQVDYTKKIFKSLVVNVAFVSIGYFLNAGFLILLPNMQMSQIQIVYGIYVLGIFTSIASISNAPALYIFSTDYRNAFKEVLLNEKSQSGVGPGLGTQAKRQVTQQGAQLPAAQAWTTSTARNH